MKKMLAKCLCLPQQIGTKIWVYFAALYFLLLVSLLAVLNLGLPGLESQGFRARLMGGALHNLNDMADLKRDRLSQWISERRLDLEGFAACLAPGGCLAPCGAAQPTTIPKLEKHLQRLRQGHPEYEILFLLSHENKRVLVSSSPMNEAVYLTEFEWLTHNGSSEVVSLIKHQENSSGYSLLMGRLLPDQCGQSIAKTWIFAQINPVSFLSMLDYRLLGLGQHGESFLVDRNRRNLNRLQRTYLTSSSTEALDKVMESPAARFAAMGYEGIIQGKDYQGVNTLAAFRQVRVNADTSWGLVVKQDQADILASINQASWFSLFVGLVGLLAAGFFIRFLARNITRPISQLTAVADEVQSGNLTARAETKGEDEVGRLAMIFNNIIDRAFRTQEQLNAEVDQQTTQLTRANLLLEDMERISQIGAWELVKEPFSLNFSKGALAIYGLEQMPTREKALSHYAPTSQPLMQKAFESLVEQGLPVDVTADFVNQRGESRKVRVIGKPLFSGTEILGAAGVLQDITESYQAQQQVLAERNQAQQYLNIAEAILMALDIEGRITLLNPKGCEILEISAEDAIGKNWFQEFLPPEVQEEVTKVFGQMMSGHAEQVVYNVNEVLTSSGSRKTIQWHNSLIKDEAGCIRGTFSSGQNITQQRAFEAEMMRLKAAIDTVGDIVFVLDASGQVRYGNPAFQFALSRFPMASLIHPLTAQPASPAADSPMSVVLATKSEWKGELCHRVHQREPIYYQATLSPLFNTKGNLASVIVIASDTTETKLKQAALIQSQKMEALGTLAGGVAHEINNPMSFVYSNLNTLNEYMQHLVTLLRLYQQWETQGEAANSELRQQITQAKADADLEYILGDLFDLISDSLEGAERVREIVSNLKDFGHPGSAVLKLVDLNQSLEKAIKILWNELKFKCIAETRFGALPLVECFPQQINQVFLNVILNASHAIETNGHIQIETRLNGEFVEIDITDNGCGIEEAHLSKIFEPFFTTKQVGQGTGLGLAVSYQIISDHGGEISVQSQKGVGTTFTISLPIKQTSKESHEPANQS